MKPKEIIERLQNELRQRFRMAGPGSVGRVEDALGLSTGYFRDQRRPDRLRLDLRIFVQALELLAIDTGPFFATTLGRVDPLETFLKESKDLREGDRRLPDVFQAIARRAPGKPRRTYDLEAWKEMVSDDPANARREISVAVVRIADEQLADVLGLHASACLALGQIDHAQMILGVALEQAIARDAPGSQAELLLIAAGLTARQERFDLALRMAETATLRFITAGQMLGVGRSLIQQGRQLRALGKEKEAQRAFDRALTYLPTESEDSSVFALRRSALQGLRRPLHSASAGLEASQGNSQTAPR